jgi:hypothetical protein
LDTEGEIIIDKIKSVTTFYKPEPEYNFTFGMNNNSYLPCQLVKYIQISKSSENDTDLKTYCIGKISSVNYATKECVIELCTIIKNNHLFDEEIDKLSLISNNDETNTIFTTLFKSFDDVQQVLRSNTNIKFVTEISFNSIYDTSLLYGISSAQCGFTVNVKVTYTDYDLYNPEFDRQVTYVSFVYKYIDDENKVLFIIPEYVQNIRPELKPLKNDTEPTYAYITFDIINNELKETHSGIIKNECNISAIFNQIEKLSLKYDSKQHNYCILIEELNEQNDNYVTRGFDENNHLDKLYFSDNTIIVNTSYTDQKEK